MAIHALVIDDDKFNLEVLGHLLKAEGATFTPVQDVTRLEDILKQQNQIDIVFLDLEMPKMDGYEIFGFLRQYLGQDIPIIACTVHINEIDNVREIGFNGFLGKPLDQTRFTTQFARLRNNQSVWDIG